MLNNNKKGDRFSPPTLAPTSAVALEYIIWVMGATLMAVFRRYIILYIDIHAAIIPRNVLTITYYYSTISNIFICNAYLPKSYFI